MIPDAALDQHVAILGKTGSGKTYTAKGAVERLLEQGRRVCIIDPTGAWWGLRAAADGKGAGFPVVVFGGDHADVPIVEASAAPLADSSGYKHGTGTFNNILGQLRSLGLADYPTPGQVRAEDLLFIG